MQPGLVSRVFVGRGAELSTLVAALDSAIASRPTVVLVGGEAGVGKSRLVEEAAEHARAQGTRVLTGSCIEVGGEGLPLSPVVDALPSLIRTMAREELDQVLGPAPLPVLALAGSYPAAVVLAGVFGAGSLVAEVVADTRLQRSLDPAVFARACGFVVPANLAGIVAGALAAPVLVALVGLSGALVTIGSGVLAYTALVLASPGALLRSGITVRATRGVPERARS